MLWGLVLGFEHPVNHIEMNHTFNIPWHQFKTQVIKLQVKGWITGLDTSQPTATATTTATRSKTINNNHISIIIYIARSPDLSPIEHRVCDVLGRRMRANHPPPFGLNQVFRTVAAGVAIKRSPRRLWGGWPCPRGSDAWTASTPTAVTRASDFVQV